MIKRFALALLLCLSALAGDQTETIITGTDGNQYKLVKAEQKLPNGVTSIAEYVRVGDNSGSRYGMLLGAKGAKPAFWQIKGR